MPADPAVGAEVGLPGRVAMIFGLAGLAITQPMLDLFGRNPEFFIQGRYSTPTVVLFALLIAVVPASQLSLVVVTAHHVRPALGRALHIGVLALLGALFASALVRGLGSDGWMVAVVAAAAGAGAAVLLTRVAPGRLLLTYLAAGNVLFVAGFLFISPTSSLVLGSGTQNLGEVSVPELPGPVVVVVLDEFPLTTLLRTDGTINGERFPAFAELAQRTTWYRNASTLHTQTDKAVPAILTGNSPARGDLPTHLDHPRSIFTLLGQSVPVERYELLTDLCPTTICDPPASRPSLAAFKDASVVYGHRILPAAWRTWLPSIGHSWGGFGDELGDAGDLELVDGDDDTIDVENPFAKWHGLDETERSAAGQAAILRSRAAAIDARPALHMIHVALPHYPWALTPWGTRLMEYPLEIRPGEYPDQVLDPADPAYQWIAHLQYQLQSMQSGAADAALGTLIDRLDESGAWDDTTLVVLSDHGTSLRAPDFGRKPTPRNEQEVFRVPLFIKAAGQAQGALVDDPALTIDVLPTLVDLLDITTDWEFDGHSLLDGSRGSIEPRVGRAFEPALEVVRAHAGANERWDWIGLAASGQHAAMVGERTSSFTIGRPSERTWTPDHEADFASLPRADGAAPQLLTGVVHHLPEGSRRATDRPPELVVSVNGRIAGCLAGYTATDGGWRFLSYLAPFLRTGANDIRAYEVERTPAGPVLHEVT